MEIRRESGSLQADLFVLCAPIKNRGVFGKTVFSVFEKV
jgi:hypothetical protein